MEQPAADQAKKGGLFTFPAVFWVANVMEIFERMGWYGFYAVSSLYLTGRVIDGGLGNGTVEDPTEFKGRVKLPTDVGLAAWVGGWSLALIGLFNIAGSFFTGWSGQALFAKRPQPIAA